MAPRTGFRFVGRQPTGAMREWRKRLQEEAAERQARYDAKKPGHQNPTRIREEPSDPVPTREKTTAKQRRKADRRRNSHKTDR